MGEYAKYKDIEVKIGTCEDMYYLRYEDRYMVKPLPGSLDPVKTPGLRFRLPFPDEDNLTPGQYPSCFRAIGLYQVSETGHITPFDFPVDLDPGLIQLSHKSGILINLPCYHGKKLPKVSEDIHVFWNGRYSYFFELCAVRFEDNTPLGIIQCRACGKMFNYPLIDLLEWINDESLKTRLNQYLK